MTDTKKATNPSPGPRKPIPRSPVKKRPKKKVSAGTIVSILLVIGVIGFCTVVYLDVGGLKVSVAALLQLDAPTAEQITLAEQQLGVAEAKQEEIDQQAQTLQQTARDLTQKESDLEHKEAELTDKEKALNERENALDLAEKNAGDAQQTMEATVLMFEQMDAEKAATAISGMDTVEEMAKLLINMASDKAALIMDNMDPDLVTEILSAMMSQ